MSLRRALGFRRDLTWQDFAKMQDIVQKATGSAYNREVFVKASGNPGDVLVVDLRGMLDGPGGRPSAGALVTLNDSLSDYVWDPSRSPMSDHVRVYSMAWG